MSHHKPAIGNHLHVRCLFDVVEPSQPIRTRLAPPNRIPDSDAEIEGLNQIDRELWELQSTGSRTEGQMEHDPSDGTSCGGSDSVVDQGSNARTWHTDDHHPSSQPSSIMTTDEGGGENINLHPDGPYDVRNGNAGNVEEDWITDVNVGDWIHGTYNPEYDSGRQPEYYSRFLEDFDGRMDSSE